MASDRRGEGLGQSFEDGLGYVVAVGSVWDVDVQVEPAIIGEAAEHFLQTLDVEIADLVCPVVNVINAARPARQIDRDVGDGLLHWHGAVTVSGDTLFVVQCLKQGLAETYPDVFDRMVRIDLQVAFCPDDQVDFAVLAQVREHVVEKTDARVDFIFALAVQIHCAGDIGFVCLPVDFRCSAFHENILIFA